tara:strand:+ start:839 stop:1978 length:1140 start_codon:yes stop_codon:yes gene_type:complete
MASTPQQVKGLQTRNGKPVWKNDQDIENYSEKTATYDYGTGYIVTPTINPETGKLYKIDDLFAHYNENGPYDLYTGEKLPVFEDEGTAIEYSKWRSDNLLNFDITDQEFYAGESDTYFKQDGSATTMADRKQDVIDFAADTRDKIYGFFGSQDEGSSYALGGIPTATKGITTQEGRDMAAKKFQLDKKKADTDGDGELSKYEEVKGEAIQKAIENDELVEMSHGGMACGCGAMEECGCGGMMTDGIMGYDNVSGNPIPVGSHAANVRDDIDAKLSTDEYVLPAHVVKWHGLKHIQTMQSEAEMGLMSMKMDGLIQHAESSDTEMVEEEEIEEPEEDLDVETAAVEVDDLTDENEDTEKVYPQTSDLPRMLKKQKYAFII